MILNVVKQPVRAKYADEFPSLVADFVNASRAEPGCLSFDWCRSADDPNLYFLIETFVDAVERAYWPEPTQSHDEVVSVMRAFLPTDELQFLMELSIEPVAAQLGLTAAA